MAGRFLLFIALSTFNGWSTAASPYENLTFALKQQQIINDLRLQCGIETSVSDDKIRKVFVNSQPNHEFLSLAAQAYDQKDRQRYARAIGNIRCPEVK